MNQTSGLLLLGFLAGALGGVFGLGGGAIMVPALVLFLGFEQKAAVGTSLAAMLLPVGLLGVLVYAREGNLGWGAAGLLAAGLVLGSLVGAMFANQTWVSANAIRISYGLLLIAIGLRYLVGVHPDG